ncbi:MAG: flagellin FliC [Burkholderiales bacterium]|nr:flagellin FliC [Burkholderiales bacterium]
MAQTINTNMVSLNAQRNQAASQSSLATSMQRLSSGLRVNSAKDDAAGLAIAERMTAQVRGMNVAMRNANDAISLAQTAEGSLGKISDNLQRMRELAVQSRNATNSDSDRASLQKEFKQLQDEVGRTINSSSFNSKSLLKGDTSTVMTFQVGAGTTSDDQISISSVNLTAGAATLVGAVTAVTSGVFTGKADGVILETAFSAMTSTTGTGIAIGNFASTTATTTAAIGTAIDNAINVIDEALDRVNAQRATFGAAQNRFDAVISNLQVSVENQSAARGRIMDADFAQETANLSRAQILQQAGNAMIAQANQMPQQVLKLLQG